MLVQPFTREKNDIHEIRRLIILENLYRSVWLSVSRETVLQRYQNHADVDRELRELLAQLPHDVISWNVRVSRPEEGKNNLSAPGQSVGRVGKPSRSIVGSRFDPKVRVDFRLHADRNHGANFFRRKVSTFVQVFAAVLTCDSGGTQTGQGIVRAGRQEVPSTYPHETCLV